MTVIVGVLKKPNYVRFLNRFFYLSGALVVFSFSSGLEVVGNGTQSTYLNPENGAQNLAATNSSNSREGTISLKKENVDLVPEVSNPWPDYFCTWNVQGYVCSYKSSQA